MNLPSISRVTIVVTQRERVSLTRDSLTSLLECTDQPFDLVVVTGGLRGRLGSWLDQEARSRGFIHVDAGRPLTPAEARNIGIDHAKTEYVAFVENDVLFTRGWLAALLACADESGASVVAPVTCEGRPLHTILHHIGPVESNEENFIREADGLDFDEDFFKQGQDISKIENGLVRRRTKNVEMHCFLARRALFDRIGRFDPVIVSKEYLDFSWRLRAAGEPIWFEPDSIVTFLVPSDDDPVRPEDLPHFLLRWSLEWQKRSHDALKAKWGLKEDGYVTKRRGLADWRIVDHVTQPALECVPLLGRKWGFVQRAAVPVNALLIAASSFLAWRYDQARSAIVEPTHETE